MGVSKFTPVLRGVDHPKVVAAAERVARQNAEVALSQAMAIIDLLQGAAAHRAIEPPSNEESLAQTLDVVHGLLDQVRESLLGKAQLIARAQS